MNKVYHPDPFGSETDLLNHPSYWLACLYNMALSLQDGSSSVEDIRCQEVTDGILAPAHTSLLRCGYKDISKEKAINAWNGAHDASKSVDLHQYLNALGSEGEQGHECD